ncbi:MAG: hypothetical protein KC425_13355 [Anaerolineales bacterium]|nr:hypothetical protein [Anaerolineales bacterium]
MKRTLGSFGLLLTLWLLAACAQLPATPAVDGTAVPSAAAVLPTGSVRELPVTFTPAATAAPVSPTPLPTPTAAGPTATPIDFDETAVELRYAIPALGLDRRLQGNISSQIIYADETVGLFLQRRNQSAVLLELQQVLPDMTLEPVPEGCDTCVEVSYDLPLSGEARSGWLQDPVLLASIENLLASVLGPHFPPETRAGLRRSASPYAPAHTVALTADGNAWVWLATDAEVLAAPLETAVPGLDALLAGLDLAAVPPTLTASCAGVPLETLVIGSGEETAVVEIACPEFTLPTTLLPLYLALDGLAAPRLAALAGPEPPPAGFPLTALLDYRRADGARLTLYRDGLARAAGAAGEVVTTTLGAAEVISLTTGLVDGGFVALGLTSFGDDVEGTSQLLVRGAGGVYDARWEGAETAVSAVDALLDGLLETAVAPEVIEPQPAETPPDASPSPAADTPTPAASPTP